MVSLSLFSLVVISGQLCAEVVQNKPVRSKPTTLDGLAGTFPARIRYIINQLKESCATVKSDKPSSKAFCKNCLLLCGPAGNGKTTLAKKIAEQSGAYCLYVNAPELMSNYYGGAAANIRKAFEAAYEHANKNNQPVVIIFDEMDILAANVEPGQKPETLAALQELWHQLDTVRDDARIFFIGATNKEELHATLKTRFGNNIEKIDVPNKVVIGKAKKEALSKELKARFGCNIETIKALNTEVICLSEKKELPAELMARFGCNIACVKRKIVSLASAN